MLDTAFIDMAKRVAITAMFSDYELMTRLTVKGGTALELVYNASSRASRDVDFSMEGEFDDISTLEKRAGDALRRAFDEKGFALIDFKVEPKPAQVSDDLKGFWGGYRLTFKIVKKTAIGSSIGVEELRRHAIQLIAGESPTFEIDISRHEAIVERHEAEIDGYTIYAYTPAMIVAEKLRAICQQTREYSALVKRGRQEARRGRDFLDIWVICERLGVDVSQPSFHDILREVFAAKRVDLSLLDKIDDYREFHSKDFEKLKDTVRPGFHLEPFDFYFNYVQRLRDLLQPLWEENSPT